MSWPADLWDSLLPVPRQWLKDGFDAFLRGEPAKSPYEPSYANGYWLDGWQIGHNATELFKEAGYTISPPATQTTGQEDGT